MEKMKQYRKRPGATITAVQINLDIREGRMLYYKWAGWQSAKEGDWLVNNDGDCYTIDDESFQATYIRVSDGVYAKAGRIWAQMAEEPGRIKTKEGFTGYDAGDWVVANNEDGSDSYAIGPTYFHQNYEEIT